MKALFVWQGGLILRAVSLEIQSATILQSVFFRGENADLGQLPEPRWGMADGWQIYNGEYQIWLANGVDQTGQLLPTSAYASETSGGFLDGPKVPEPLYRLEGDGWEGRFYTIGGAQGGFMNSPYTYLLEHCPECFQIFTPLVVK